MSKKIYTTKEIADLVLQERKKKLEERREQKSNEYKKDFCIDFACFVGAVAFLWWFGYRVCAYAGGM